MRGAARDGENCGAADWPLRPTFTAPPGLPPHWVLPSTGGAHIEIPDRRVFSSTSLRIGNSIVTVTARSRFFACSCRVSHRVRVQKYHFPRVSASGTICRDPRRGSNQTTCPAIPKQKWLVHSNTQTAARRAEGGYDMAYKRILGGKEVYGQGIPGEGTPRGSCELNQA